MLPLYDSWCALLVPFCRFHGHLQWTPVSLLRLFSTISTLLRVTFAMPILSQEDTNELDAGSTGQTSNASCQTPAAQQIYQRAIPRNPANPNPPSSQNVQTFCLKRSMLVRVHPASGTSSSMSRLEFRLRTAAAVETSEHSGIRAVILGAPSFPANTLEDFACSWSLLMRICLARLRRSILLTTCWWGVLRLPNSKERELTLPIQHSQQSPAWWW